jgi:hypothetical protein
MTDTEAIALYVAAGNPEVLWHAEDEMLRLYYRMAAQIKAMEAEADGVETNKAGQVSPARRTS